MPLHFLGFIEVKFAMTTLPGHCKFTRPENGPQLSNSGKTVSDLFMPISGEILEFNVKLEDDAELINKDPFGEGWMIRVSIDNQQDIDKLLSPEQYRDLIAS
jgi:glycine cleavage system H lipoate-binding protein